MKKLVPIIFMILVCVSCSWSGAVSPRGAFVMLVNSIENSDIEMFKKIQSKDSIKFFEDIANKLSNSNTAQRDYLSKRYGVPKDFTDDVNYNNVMEFYLLAEKEGNFLKSLKSGIASIDRTANKAVIVTNSSTQVLFVKEGSFWKVELR